MSVDLAIRVQRKRISRHISIRALAKLTGVSFSTLARVERGEGAYSDESARRLKAWLGDDVSAIVSDAQREKAYEWGRYVAHAFEDQLRVMIREMLK